jgi:hypothetical protein
MNLCLHDCLHRQEEVISGADALIVREPSVPFVDDAPPQAQTGGPTRNLPRKGSKLTRFNQGFMRRSCALGDGGSSEGEQLGFPAPARMRTARPPLLPFARRAHCRLGRNEMCSVCLHGA